MKKQGFTLIELLVVISIIGLLSSIVYTNLQTARAKAKIAAGLSFSQSLYHVLGAEAVGVWNFEDDITDGQTSDGSGNGNNGTIYGNPVQEDSGIPALRKALKFDGSSYISRLSLAGDSLNPLTAITIEAWVKPTVAQQGTIVSRNGPYALFINANGTIGVWILITSWESLTTSDTILLNQWSHLAATYDGINMKIYINGALSASGAPSVGGNISLQPPRTFFIGYGDPGLNQYFSGLIDEVRVYGQALTTAEIQKHYAEGLGKFNLVKN